MPDHAALNEPTASAAGASGERGPAGGGRERPIAWVAQPCRGGGSVRRARCRRVGYRLRARLPEREPRHATGRTLHIGPDRERSARIARRVVAAEGVTSDWSLVRAVKRSVDWSDGKTRQRTDAPLLKRYVRPDGSIVEALVTTALVEVDGAEPCHQNDHDRANAVPRQNRPLPHNEAERGCGDADADRRCAAGLPEWQPVAAKGQGACRRTLRDALSDHSVARFDFVSAETRSWRLEDGRRTHAFRRRPRFCIQRVPKAAGCLLGIVQHASVQAATVIAVMLRPRGPAVSPPWVPDEAGPPARAPTGSSGHQSRSRGLGDRKRGAAVTILRRFSRSRGAGRPSVTPRC